jgi:hypothetical protein
VTYLPQSDIWVRVCIAARNQALNERARPVSITRPNCVANHEEKDSEKVPSLGTRLIGSRRGRQPVERALRLLQACETDVDA